MQTLLVLTHDLAWACFFCTKLISRLQLHVIGRAPVLSRVLAPLPGSLSDGSRPSLSFDAPQHRA